MCIVVQVSSSTKIYNALEQFFNEIYAFTNANYSIKANTCVYFVLFCRCSYNKIVGKLAQIICVCGKCAEAMQTANNRIIEIETVILPRKFL